MDELWYPKYMHAVQKYLDPFRSYLFYFIYKNNAYYAYQSYI